MSRDSLMRRLHLLAGANGFYGDVGECLFGSQRGAPARPYPAAVTVPLEEVAATAATAAFRVRASSCDVLKHAEPAIPDADPAGAPPAGCDRSKRPRVPVAQEPECE